MYRKDYDPIVDKLFEFSFDLSGQNTESLTRSIKLLNLSK